MDMDTGGEFPPDSGLIATALAITSTTEILNNKQITINENLGTITGKQYPVKDTSTRTETVSRFLTNINNDIINKKPNENIGNDINKSPLNIQTSNNQKSSQQEALSKESAQKRPVYFYENTDSGPYVVYIENKSPNFNGKLSALKVGEIIFNIHPELDSRIKNIDSLGRNRIKIVFKDLMSANILIKSSLLI